MNVESLEGILGFTEVAYEWRTYQWSEEVAEMIGDDIVVLLGMVRAAREPYTVKMRNLDTTARTFEARQKFFEYNEDDHARDQ